MKRRNVIKRIDERIRSQCRDEKVVQMLHDSLVLAHGEDGKSVNLSKLAESSFEDFWHDVNGVNENASRPEGGRLMNSFVPRCGFCEDDEENGNERKEDPMEVYVLKEKYGDNDTESVGAYASLPALCKGFAERIVSGNIPSSYKPDELEVIVGDIAAKVAQLLPALLGNAWAGDECRDGDTVYGIDRLDVSED